VDTTKNNQQIVISCPTCVGIRGYNKEQTTNDQVRIRNTIILAAMGSVETTASSVGALRQGNGSAAVACLSVMGVRERERWRKEVASGHVPCRTLSHVSLQLRGASGNAKLGSEDAALCRPGNSSYGSLRYASIPIEL
jgi:hypothetical protein